MFLVFGRASGYSGSVIPTFATRAVRPAGLLQVSTWYAPQCWRNNRPWRSKRETGLPLRSFVSLDYVLSVAWRPGRAGRVTTDDGHGYQRFEEWREKAGGGRTSGAYLRSFRRFSGVACGMITRLCSVQCDPDSAFGHTARVIRGLRRQTHASHFSIQRENDSDQTVCFSQFSRTWV
jgi:hypothetical protein